MEIPIIKISWSHERLILIMRISVHGKTIFHIETRSSVFWTMDLICTWIIFRIFNYHSVYRLSQWEEALLCNAFTLIINNTVDLCDTYKIYNATSCLSIFFLSSVMCCFNSLRPRQDGRHFPDDIFKCIFLNENVWISIKISLKFVSKGSINNIAALVQIMAWRRPGDKPLSEPMMVSLLTHICVTRPQWVKCKSNEIDTSISALHQLSTWHSKAILVQY